MRPFLLVSATALLCLAPTAAEAQVYGDNNSLVDSWYRTYLGRAPDPGAATWVNELNQGTPADQVLASILASPEYYSRVGSTPEGYITHLYSDTLQRLPTPSELSYWQGRMYTTDRVGIADAVLTQNPGVWVHSGPAVAPPTVVTPPAVVAPSVVVPPRAGWDRDRHGDWDRHHDIHEYHRPDVYIHRDDHHGPHH